MSLLEFADFVLELEQYKGESKDNVGKAPTPAKRPRAKDKVRTERRKSTF